MDIKRTQGTTRNFIPLWVKKAQPLYTPLTAPQGPRKEQSEWQCVLRGSNSVSPATVPPSWEIIFNPEPNTQLNQVNCRDRKRLFQTHTKTQKRRARQRLVSQGRFLPPAFLTEIILSFLGQPTGLKGPTHIQPGCLRTCLD